MLTPKTKELMHRVIDGDIEALPIMHQLTRYTHADNILSWLKMNNITGKTLVDWHKNDFKKSTLGMVNFICQRYNKSKEKFKTIYGRDWK